jgi:hypothetical protein
LPWGWVTAPIRHRPNSRWAPGHGDVVDPGSESMLRRGKSQGRGECEIELTRIQREENVKRVNKPCRRN